MSYSEYGRQRVTAVLNHLNPMLDMGYDSHLELDELPKADSECVQDIWPILLFNDDEYILPFRREKFPVGLAHLRERDLEKGNYAPILKTLTIQFNKRLDLKEGKSLPPCKIKLKSVVEDWGEPDKDLIYRVRVVDLGLFGIGWRRKDLSGIIPKDLLLK